ncbi:MAG TPA: RagB/SusD family nutrient uptake outer membrane protein, partial [Bacteroidales bacterium]|nr:RagB/SusD family nutrient uptake outer membrane protein [Bacteroidales bacterium]
EDTPWDYERMGKNEFVDRIVQDWDSAYYYFNLAGKIRRDPGTLQYGTYEMHRPNGMAAKAFKARALLYAASPLNNKNGLTDWEEAAAAAWEAIQIAEANGVVVLPLTDASGNDRHLNFYGADVCEESIWTRSMGNQSWNWSGGTLYGGHFMSSTSASGIFPTQNWVDRYETRWGDPLVTQADRDAATALGHYNEQQPFKDRDPRFYKDIIYNGSPAPGWGGGSEGASNTAWMYYNGTTPTTLLNTSYPGRTYTGYAMRKVWNNNSTKNQSTSAVYSDPLARLSELYMNYAEAVNEAYGPAGNAPTCPMNAWDALDVIRLKSGMPAIDRVKYSTKELLRPRIKNERCVEFAFESQFYYDDLRRWMDLPEAMGSKLIANIPQKTTVSATYPDGFIYSRTLLPPDRQPAWEEGMYYLYFLNTDALKMKKFVANPAW